MPAAPDDDTQQLFFDMLDRLTPTHVRMLKLLSDPPGRVMLYMIATSARLAAVQPSERT